MNSQTGNRATRWRAFMIFSENEDWLGTSRRALCELDANSPDATMDGKPLWQDYLPEAWAAIMALREPDPANDRRRRR